MATARPRNAADRRRQPVEPAALEREPARAGSRAAPAWRSSSARRLTRKPIDAPLERRRVAPRPNAAARPPGRGGRPERTPTASSPASPSTSRTRRDAARGRAPRRASPTLVGVRGDHGQRRAAGTIARSPGSSASNAGTRALHHADPARSRARRDPGRAGSVRAGAGGKIASASVAQAGHQRRRLGPASAAAGPRSPAPRRGRRAAARTRARSRRSGRSGRRRRAAVGSEPGPDPAPRQVERDREPGDERRERRPDDRLARDRAWR